MDRKTIRLLSLVSVLFITLAATACEDCEDCNCDDEEGGSTTTAKGGKGGATTAKGGAGGSGETGGTGGTAASETKKKHTFSGVLRDSTAVNPFVYIEDATIKALGNDNGSELGVEATTDVDGKFTLKDVNTTDRMGLVAIGSESTRATDKARVDSYTFNLRSDSTNYPINSSSLTIAKVVEGADGKGYSPDDATVVTGVFALTSKGEALPVACAIVKVTDAETGEEVGTTYYIDATKMPNVKGELKKTGKYGAAIVMHIQNTTKVKVTATVNDEEIASETVPVVPNKVGTKVGPDNEARAIIYNRLYPASDTDLTPEGCDSKDK